jgi:hypothetical protein
MPGYVPAVEYLSGLGEAVYREAADARGGTAAAGFLRKGAFIETGGEAAWSGEWRTPLFRPDAYGEREGSLLRAGSYAASSHALWNGTLEMHLGMGRDPDRALRLEAGWRRFFGADAGRMEFRPSRWWASVRGHWSFPSDLRAEGRLNWMGAKEVRGWGPVFRAPAHFENALGLSQSLPGDRVVLRFSLLHAFGADLREQPDGNPLRFRVLGGAEAVF